MSYYRGDLALVHHRGFGFHADLCAPGILEILAPVRHRGGVVLEFGCGSGLFTAHLIAAGHRVRATDASPAMLALAARHLGDSAEELFPLALPDDPIPDADAIVGVGHPISYLSDADSIDRAIVAMAEALRPGGVLAFDICDLEWGRARTGVPAFAACGEDWAIITQFSQPSPECFVRDITTFVANGDGSWRRDQERHENILVDTAHIPDLLAGHGVDARVGTSFGSESLPVGLHTVVGHKRAPR